MSEERAIEQHSALQAVIAAPAVQRPCINHCEPLTSVEASVRLRCVCAWNDVGRSHIGLYVLQCDERDDDRGAFALAIREVGMQRLALRARVRDERGELIQSAVCGAGVAYT
eukprot:scaffold12171_cov61-Phaeocystis_antarctica.AAC.5